MSNDRGSRVKDHRPESVVYVELDAYLDTRLAALGAISPKAATDCSQDPAYFDRVIDDFESICGVTREAFRNAYSLRDEEFLRASVITEIPFILDDLVRKLEAETVDTPFLSRVIVEVNTYPYKLDKETLNALSLAVMSRAGIETEVRCVSIPLERLTPTFCKERYGGLILYNFHDWMKHHLTAFEKVKMPTVTVMAPALYRDTVPSEDAFSGEGISKHITGFQLSEVGCVELFSLSLLPAANFSMVRVPGHYKPKPAPVVPKEEMPVPTPGHQEFKIL
ncbi:hypothetical protein [Xanthomonas phage RTH11]|nr:hypothetical protein [Xanthomonas phage RTH11]